jgi:hypothetical protein
LMLLEGETERALALGNALVTAAHWRGYKPNASMFTEAFILRLLAGHLGRKTQPVEWPIFKKKAPTPHLAYEALLASWDAKDPKAVKPLLLAALDWHTQLGFSGKNWMEREFTNGFWMRTPLAALMVLKLRELRGLKNPALEHLVLESPMGRMPKPGYAPDPTIAKLKRRLEKEIGLKDVPKLYKADRLPARV